MNEEERQKEPDRMSSAIGELAAALSAAQGEFEAIQAERTGQTGHRQYKYADLNSFLTAARGVLSKHGLAVVQRPLDADDAQTVRLETILTHKSGQWIGSVLRIKSTNATAQAIGSAMTYARRYSLASMLGLAPEEDDDGKQASAPVRITATLCNEHERQRIINAAQSLEWNVEKLTEVIARAGKTKLKQLTQQEAISLAERLEKKFLQQQAKETF